MNNYYVYVWYIEKISVPFYVGCSKKVLGTFSRAFRDIKKIPKEELLCAEKYALDKIYKVGIYKENMDKREASNLEQKLIKQYGRKYFDTNGILYNIDTTPYFKQQQIKKPKKKLNKLTKENYKSGILGNIEVKRQKSKIIDKYGFIQYR
jgi:ribosomal protein S20